MLTLWLYTSVRRTYISFQRGRLLLIRPPGKARSLTLPDAVTEICDNVFEGCSNLASVTLPATVKTIGKSAFMSCYELVSLNIPASVTSIGEDFVSGCRKLENITVAVNNENYASVDGLLYNKGVTELIVCPPGSLIKDLVIPATVKTVLTAALYRVNSLNSLTIPASVTEISGSAISGCSNLASITVADDNSVYASDDGILYDKKNFVNIMSSVQNKYHYTCNRYYYRKLLLSDKTQ